MGELAMSRDLDKDFEARLQEVFGRDAGCEGPLVPAGGGRRFVGIDLSRNLDPGQVNVLLDGLAHYGILSIPGQDLKKFSLARFERFANHWGALVPHPNNFLRGGKSAQSDGATDGAIEWIPFARRRFAAVNTVFPGRLECLPHESPAVLVVANFQGDSKGGGSPVTIEPGGSWHTDIEYEALPIYVSMFLAHKLPESRDAEGGSWVADPTNCGSKHAPYFEGSDPELYRLRHKLPLNGETSFSDTAAAFSALPESEQESLELTRVRRRLNEGDEGWLAPLVRTNPRSGIKSLHSPVWASRPGVRPAVEVDGMTQQESRKFLDRLEMHVLQPQFRYDHAHEPGDVTLWDNYMTLHTSPPIKKNIVSIDDARLLYRLSCKGDPQEILPRNDSPEWLEEHINGAYSTPEEIINSK